MKNEYLDYFKNNAEDWVEKAYRSDKGAYPTAIHRNRIVLSVLNGISKYPLSILDVGCGAGQLSVEMSKLGHNVIGVDQSPAMLSIAESSITKNAKAEFIESEFSSMQDKLDNKKFDVIVAMGFIGYIESDHEFFESISEMLHEGGTLIVSCRNRLFNLNSFSSYHKQELERNSIIELYDEMQEYLNDIESIGNIDSKFLSSITSAYSEAVKLVNIETKKNDDIDHSVAPVVARQHTPLGLDKSAADCNLTPINLFGVHPHVFPPFMSNMISSDVLNQFNNSLLFLENDAVSMLWSTIFIRVYKNDN